MGMLYFYEVSRTLQESRPLRLHRPTGQNKIVSCLCCAVILGLWTHETKRELQIEKFVMENSGDHVIADGNENIPQNVSLVSKDPEPLTLAAEPEEAIPKENVDFKIVYNKTKHDINFPLDNTIEQLKRHLQDLIGVPAAMQKVMYKGLAKDGLTLRDLGFSAGCKVMVVGSKLDDVIAASATPSKQAMEKEERAGAAAEPFCKQKMHRKVLDKGVPEDAMPGNKGAKLSLPHTPLAGMLNKSGGKVRLTFKMEQDMLWIGTKERTDKIPMSSIKGVLSEPIEGHEDYHIMAIQLGTTDASRYWVYWIPAQYVDAVKDAILGKWQLF